MEAYVDFDTLSRTLVGFPLRTNCAADVTECDAGWPLDWA